MAEKEVEYESDPEEAKLSLKMRRKEASDDEGEEIDLEKTERRRIEDSDGESEGAVAEYVDELAEEDYDLGDYVEDEIEEEVEVKHEERVGVERDEAVKEGEVVDELMEKKGVDNGESEVVNDGEVSVVDGQFEDKKEIEPFAVPTAGAFYMHDDRFRDNAGGRNRRTLGGRKLWESKDDRKWGHDKFEELTVKERHHEEHRRGSRGRGGGRGRGRGRNRVADLGNAHRNRPRENSNISTQYNDNRINVPRGFRGRGPQRYQQSFKNDNEGPLRQNKQSSRSVEKPPYARTSERVSNSEADIAPPRKQVVASNLNIASPPFYPTSSSTKYNSTPHINRKSTKGSIGVENLYIDDSLSAMAGKPSNNLQIPQLRGQGRGITPLTQMAYRPVVSNNQVNRAPSQSQLQSVQRSSGQIHGQSSVNAFESEVESASESSQLENVVVAKGKGNAPGSGKDSFLYGGAQVIGTSGSMGSGDQNFPTFLPVMQFGGQHPGGMGVPAVGMAFPGYVGQPQLGRGNSEMTWLPVLAGAGGALGASLPPYMSYQARPSGQTSSLTVGPSKENNATKVGNDWKPTQRPELANDEFGQRQKNPRRYTEMKFDQ